MQVQRNVPQVARNANPAQQGPPKSLATTPVGTRIRTRIRIRIRIRIRSTAYARAILAASADSPHGSRRSPYTRAQSRPARLA